MKLSERVIVRREGDGYLLYNGDTGGLIHLTEAAYDGWVVSGEHGGVAYEEAYAWLLANGFLETRFTSRPQAPVDLFHDGFYELRTETSPLNVLWALTPRCNLRCVYCFPDVKAHVRSVERLSVDVALSIAEQLIAAKVLKVTLSGGECLLYPGVWTVAERLRRAGLTVAVISNGAPIRDVATERLKALGIHVGISIDGPNDAVHGRMRGPGAFANAEAAVQRLLKADVPVVVLVTLTRHNFECLDEHFEWMARLGVRFVTLQDLRPFGTRALYDSIRLTADQEARLGERFARIRGRHPEMVINPSELFICSKPAVSGNVMSCPAGDNFAYIDFNGDVFPCTSAPTFRMGNLIDGDSLVSLWRESPAICAFRSLKRMKLADLPGCVGCTNTSHCEGGCRSDALFYHGDLYARPSRCPKDMGVLAEVPI